MSKIGERKWRGSSKSQANGHPCLCTWMYHLFFQSPSAPQAWAVFSPATIISCSLVVSLRTVLHILALPPTTVKTFQYTLLVTETFGLLLPSKCSFSNYWIQKTIISGPWPSSVKGKMLDLGPCDVKLLAC
jgi:hypothetical protein